MDFEHKKDVFLPPLHLDSASSETVIEVYTLCDQVTVRTECLKRNRRLFFKHPLSFHSPARPT